MNATRKIGRVAASTVAVLSAVLTVGCGALQSGGGDSGQQSVTQSAAPSTQDNAPAQGDSSDVQSAPSQGDGSDSGSGGSGGSASSSECQVANLKVTVAGSEGAAGTVYRTLRFTNTGSQSCEIRGYPGVSYVAGSKGTQVGEAAYRVGHKGAAVSLAPGNSASAVVGFTEAGNYDPSQCKPVAVRGLRVYPPHSYSSVFVPLQGTGCRGSIPGHQLTVKTITAG